MQEKNFVSGKIGDEYKSWEPGDNIFITTQTGSGKTFFILHELLPYAFRNNRKILYLVNRSILADQINQEITEYAIEERDNFGVDLRDYILVLTYQYLEQMYYKDKGERDEDKFNWLCKYYYVVCDECHYFINDSLFNTRTYISHFTLRMYCQAVTIYISATMDEWETTLSIYEPMRFIMQNNIQVSHPESDNPYLNEGVRVSRNFYEKIKRYDGERDYEYLQIKAFKDISDIPDLIRQEDKKEKWLIFYNDIKKGQELEKKLKEDNVDAIFIDSSYKKDEETGGTVQHIVSEQEMNCKVIIATSALDNGISIKDSGLRNLIILAENKVEFIQMLGRKREDGRKVKLFLCLRSSKDFSNRLSYLQKIEATYRFCKQRIDQGRQVELVNTLLNDIEFYKKARRFLYQTTIERRNCLPVLQINPFSIDNITAQIKFYNQQIKRFKEEGELAFLKTQCEWLNISDDNIEDMLVCIGEERKEKLQDDICAALDSQLEKNLTRNESIELKKDIKNQIKELLEQKMYGDSNLNKYLEEIRKLDRPFAGSTINEVLDKLDLPYIIEDSGARRDKVYVVKKREEDTVCKE